MTAILFNPSNRKQIYGQVIQKGFKNIILAVTDKNGSKSVKTYNRDKWIVII